MKSESYAAVVPVFSLAVSLLVCISSAPAQQPDARQARVEPLLTVRHVWEANSVAFSPDGKRLAAGSGHRGIRVWDAANGKLVWQAEGDGVGDFVLFSPDRKLLLAARTWKQGKAGGVIQFYEAATGKLIRELTGHTDLVRSIAMSPDGRTLASTSQDKTVRLWDVPTLKEVRRIEADDYGHAVAFSPDGKTLAFDVRTSVRLHDVATGKELRRLEGHQTVQTGKGTFSGLITALAFSADGKQMASASWDTTARVWDAATGKLLHVLEGHQGPVNAVTFHPDGKVLVTGGEDGTIRLWSIQQGTQLGQVQAHHAGQRDDGDTRKDVFMMTFSPDGKRLASGGRDTYIRVWDVSTLLQLQGVRRPARMALAGPRTGGRS